MHKNRVINGYIAIYCPESPSAMKSKNHKGYVYEHRLIMERMIGRALVDGEVVHHKNLNRKDNSPENLVLMKDREHKELHFEIAVETGKKKHQTCKHCGVRIPTRSSKRICNDCLARWKKEKRMRIPSRDVLLKEQEAMSYEAIGRKYGVSSSAVRKWCKSYGIASHGFKFCVPHNKH